MCSDYKGSGEVNGMIYQRCQDYGGIREILQAETPKLKVVFDPQAEVIRQVEREDGICVYIMSDSTFRFYCDDPIPDELADKVGRQMDDAGVRHFVIGDVIRKKDDEILACVKELLSGKIRWFHEDGTPHLSLQENRDLGWEMIIENLLKDPLQDLVIDPEDYHKFSSIGELLDKGSRILNLEGVNNA